MSTQTPELTIRKTIYAKRKKSDWSEEDFVRVMENEVNCYLAKYPQLKYKDISQPVINDDRSKTYLINFELK